MPVLVPVAVSGAYSYKVPAGMQVRPGSIVRVPLGPREVVGAVWDGEPDAGVNPKKLKSILHIYDAAPLQDDLRKFVDWIAKWTLGSPGMVLRMVLRSEAALEAEPMLAGVRRVRGVEPERVTPARGRVLELVDEGMAWTKPGLAGAAGVSSSVVEGLKKQGVLETVMLPATPPLPDPDPEMPGRKLTEQQITAANALISGIGKGSKTYLIDGVTGSGKTEVYFEAIAEVMRQGQQALILVPEIALTNQFLNRFEERFGAKPAEWHSQVPPKRRERTWRGVANGEVKVVVGARSSLFLPFKNLGLVVVDEEHDAAYKQDDRVSYNARDMAVLRGHIAKFPVVLASATPSVESKVNAQNGRYELVSLPERASGAEMPTLKSVDMRVEGPERGRWLAPMLVQEIATALGNGNQALLFLNRRGYAPLTLCRTCGHRFHCENCSTWLVEHRFRGKLVCHHCGYSQPVPEKCPECSKPDTLVACGPGVERIGEEVCSLFPDARVLVLSSDLPGGAERVKREMKLIEEGQVDVVIGTQLVAKGHNFPLMTLVGVIDADLGLANGDPRAAERTFQLLAQVTGRAGRIHGKGIGILQSYSPDQPVIKALLSGRPDEFYQAEIESRQHAGLPPFGRLAAIIVSGTDRGETEKYSKILTSVLPRGGDVTVLGPAEAALAQVRGRFRFRLLAMAQRGFDLQGFIRAWLAASPPVRGSLRVQVDIDPQNFF
nr:primosomal protein N' [Pseudovibrio sp. M1P-2-3]